MLRALGTHVIKPLKNRIAKLEAQIEELQVNGFKYAGVWQRAGNYRKGTGTTPIIITPTEKVTNDRKSPRPPRKSIERQLGGTKICATRLPQSISIVHNPQEF